MSTAAGSHTWAPERYVAWINDHIGFNPRSQQQSDALSQYMLDDLKALSPRIKDDFDREKVQAKLNARVQSPITQRTVDFVVLDCLAPGPLDLVRLAVEHKTIMTAHGKARLNRQGDIIAAANHLHNHSQKAIVAASLVMNVSQAYLNPDTFAKELQRPMRGEGPWAQFLQETAELFRKLPLRETIKDPNDRPEALALIMVSYDGANPARLVSDLPAPQPGEPTHFMSAYERIIRLYEQRF